MPRFLSCSLALLFFSFAVVPASLAASFDCSKAQAPDEIAICQSPALSQLDTEMGALWFTYEKIPFLMGGSGERRDDAEAFLKARSACGSNESCLRKLYDARIKALKEGISNWLKSSSGAAPVPGWSTANLPDGIQAIASGYQKMCSDIGGTLQAGFDKPMLMTGDLDGDSVQDFVLNPQNMQCSAAATTFCGNGGCYLKLALSSKNYAAPVTIMGGAPSLSQNEEGTSLDVWVENAKCKTSETASSCLGRYFLRGGKLTTAYEARQFQD